MLYSYGKWFLSYTRVLLGLQRLLSASLVSRSEETSALSGATWCMITVVLLVNWSMVVRITPGGYSNGWKDKYEIASTRS